MDKKLILTLLFVITTACSSAPKMNHKENRNNENETPAVKVSEIITPSPGPSETYGPENPPPPESVFGPDSKKQKKIILVIEAGQARSFALVGILEALDEANVPIEKIEAVEMSAVIAGLYGFSQTVNEFDWWVQKFKTEDFLESGMFSGVFGKNKIPAAGVLKKIQQAFKQPKKLSQGRVALEICGETEADGYEKMKQAVLNLELYKETDEVCLHLKPQTLPVVNPDPYSIRVAVDLGNKETQSQTSQIVLHPRLADILPTDFEHKTEIIFRGKEVVEQNLDKIQELLK